MSFVSRHEVWHYAVWHFVKCHFAECRSAINDVDEALQDNLKEKSIKHGKKNKHSSILTNEETDTRAVGQGSMKLLDRHTPVMVYMTNKNKSINCHPDHLHPINLPACLPAWLPACLLVH
jgi:hypothetical protein